MAKHAPFIDGDISTANRLMAAWLNSVQDCIWDILGDGVNPPTTEAAARTNLGAGTIGDQLFTSTTAAGALAIIGALAAADGVATGVLNISEAMKLTGSITPAAIAADTNNYAPTGFATATVLRLSTTAAWTLTGIAGGVDGRLIMLENIGANGLTLLHDVTSTAANRIYTPNAVNYQLSVAQGNRACWLRYDGSLQRWVVLGPNPWIEATKAQQETGTSGGVLVTPRRQQDHLSAAKFWAMVTVSGGTPTLQNSYNVTSITDTGTGLLTVTIATDFANTNWTCSVSVERAATALTVANLRYAAVRNAGIAAGSVLVECWDGTAVTANQVDPASWHVSGFGVQP